MTALDRESAAELAAELGVGVLVTTYPSGVIAIPARHVPAGETVARAVGTDPRTGLDALTHGTRMLYIRDCACLPCREAHRVYGKRRRYREVAYPASLGVPAAPVAEHVADLRRTMSLTAIAAAAGVNHTVVVNIARQRKVNAATARAILNVRYGQSVGLHYVSGVGSTRRLQALVALGHTPTQLAERVGLTPQNLRAILDGDRAQVWADTATRVREVYDALSMRIAPIPTDRIARGARTKALQRAARDGFAPPLAWDDDTIDDPTATPAAAYQATLRGVDVDEVDLLVSHGEHPDQIAARLNRNRDTIRQACDRAGRRDLAHYLEKAAAA